MQEGIISLMQMPRTVAAVELLNKNSIPYIVVLTDPTTGGVTASFAMLGDITIAESNSTIGFAGKRVIQDTIREELPIDFQKAEYLKKHGMIDIVVDRKELKTTLAIIISHLIKNWFMTKLTKLLARLEDLHPKYIDLSLKRINRLLFILKYLNIWTEINFGFQ